MTELADPRCTSCLGRGFVVRARETLAVAEPCTCLKDCERCRGLGQVELRSDRGVAMARCRCQMLPDRLRLFNDVRMPARHANSSLATFVPDEANGEAWNQCRRWAKEYKPGQSDTGLVLCGKVGTGKTHLLCGMLRELVFRHGVSARFVEFTHLLGELRQGYEAGLGGAQLIGQLNRFEVLAIDELGKGRKTEWEQAIVDELVSRRYNAQQPLLATTNYGIGASRAEGGGADPSRGARNLAVDGGDEPLVDRVGGRIYSRLREMCRFVPVSGEDYRARLDQLARA